MHEGLPLPDDVFDTLRALAARQGVDVQQYVHDVLARHIADTRGSVPLMLETTEDSHGNTEKHPLPSNEEVERELRSVLESLPVNVEPWKQNELLQFARAVRKEWRKSVSSPQESTPPPTLSFVISKVIGAPTISTNRRREFAWLCAPTWQQMFDFLCNERPGLVTYQAYAMATATTLKQAIKIGHYLTTETDVLAAFDQTRADDVSREEWPGIMYLSAEAVYSLCTQKFPAADLTVDEKQTLLGEVRDVLRKATTPVTRMNILNAIDSLFREPQAKLLSLYNKLHGRESFKWVSVAEVSDDAIVSCTEELRADKGTSTGELSDLLRGTRTILIRQGFGAKLLGAYDIVAAMEEFIRDPDSINRPLADADPDLRDRGGRSRRMRRGKIGS